MPRISDAELAARRQRIVGAAEACLRRDGPAGLATRAVVAEAGISPVPSTTTSPVPRPWSEAWPSSAWWPGSPPSPPGPRPARIP
ncbi:MAG TPA: hypothetical protein VK507_07980 [Iamia sp.]|nr:hypothetical protein [Iamia sp.]